eukprot:TRINITY_DN81429_c0_g1_i1.p1 TRINITY_DN81429_c0_g1~~TRINITY_DN81429_c0_g1_i1.p1  ORF type:complete len:559 (+),score=160.60 TRINITY_DN81429_c0_g1_i1:175-1851(+)
MASSSREGASGILGDESSRSAVAGNSSFTCVVKFSVAALAAASTLLFAMAPMQQDPVAAAALQAELSTADQLQLSKELDAVQVESQRAHEAQLDALRMILVDLRALSGQTGSKHEGLDFNARAFVWSELGSEKVKRRQGEAQAAQLKRQLDVVAEQMRQSREVRAEALRVMLRQARELRTRAAKSGTLMSTVQQGAPPCDDSGEQMRRMRCEASLASLQMKLQGYHGSSRSQETNAVPVSGSDDSCPRAESAERELQHALRELESLRGASSSSSGAVSATDFAVGDAVAEGVEKKAERQYWYQRMEKNQQVHPAFVRYGANWPCIWGEELTGTAFGDGNKWTCGVRRLRKPCVVYSFGSRGNMHFENGIEGLGVGCEVHIYDPTIQELRGAQQKGFKFHAVGLGTLTGFQALANGAGILPVTTLQDAMKKNGHDHLDILKIDIEYMEHPVLEQISRAGWPSVGQLLLEVHIEGKAKYDGSSLETLFQRVEKANLRLFHHEVNWEFGASCCIEYSFLHMHWRPGVRKYDMNTAPSFRDLKLKTYPQHKHLIAKYLSGKG